MASTELYHQQTTSKLTVGLPLKVYALLLTIYFPMEETNEGEKKKFFLPEPDSCTLKSLKR